MPVWFRREPFHRECSCTLRVVDRPPLWWWKENCLLMVEQARCAAPVAHLARLRLARWDRQPLRAVCRKSRVLWTWCNRNLRKPSCQRGTSGLRFRLQMYKEEKQRTMRSNPSQNVLQNVSKASPTGDIWFSNRRLKFYPAIRLPQSRLLESLPRSIERWTNSAHSSSFIGSSLSLSISLSSS